MEPRNHLEPWTRRQLLKSMAAGAVGLAALPFVQACAPPVAPSAAPAGEAGSAAAEPITLRMWHWDNYLLEPYTKLGEKYKEAHPDVTLVMEPTTFNEFPQKLSAAILGGTPPDIAATAEGTQRINFYSQGQFMELGPFVERDQFDLEDFKLFVKEHSWKGTLYGLPNHHAFPVWFYNVDMFEKEGVKTPEEHWKEGTWDWTTYLDTASQLTKGEGSEKQWGSANLSPGWRHMFFPLIWSNDGAIFDKEYTKATLTEPKTFAAFQFGYDVRQFAPGPEDAQSGTSESGRIGMYPNWVDRYVLQLGKVPFEYRVLPPPASPDTGKSVFLASSTGLAIPKGVADGDQAWELMKFLVSPEALTDLFVAVANMPPRLSMRTEDLWDKNPDLPDPQMLLELDKATLETYGFMPKISNFPQMGQALNEEMTLVWTDEETLEAGVAKAEARWNDLLKEGQIDLDV